MKHLVSINDLDKDSALALLDLADELKSSLLEREIRKLPTLRGRTVFTVFYENSTRTRSSFETAAKWLSADVVNISAGSSSVKKGESLQDTGQTLTAIGAEALIVRHPNSGAPAQLAQWLSPDGVMAPPSSTLVMVSTNTPPKRFSTRSHSASIMAVSTVANWWLLATFSTPV